MKRSDLSIGAIGVVGAIVSLAVAVGLETVLKGAVAIAVGLAVLAAVAGLLINRRDL